MAGLKDPQTWNGPREYIRIVGQYNGSYFKLCPQLNFDQCGHKDYGCLTCCGLITCEDAPGVVIVWGYFICESFSWGTDLVFCSSAYQVANCYHVIHSSPTDLGKVTHMWGAHEQVFLQHQQEIWYENICIQESLLCSCIRARILWPTFQHLEGFNVIFWVFNWILKFEHELSFIYVCSIIPLSMWPWISVGRIKAQQELMYRVC